MEQFLKDVIQDLSGHPKRLNSKYFYDETGSRLFQQIMNCEEYYQTDCELEIFQEKTSALATVLKDGFDDFDLVELGAGDATKSSYLLRELVETGVTFTYRPIDISFSMIDHLEKDLPVKIPGLRVKGLCGDYFDMLDQTNQLSVKKKVILFMGGNIGNFEVETAVEFCENLRRYLNPGDLVLIGFDLKKHPRVIRAAYNDSEGYTKAFNLNLLHRINKELGGNFVVEQFEHYPSYDPGTGACRSYLISLKDQLVKIGDHEFLFKNNEYISMEISQKYAIAETEEMALKAGYLPVQHFTDQKNWFLDTVWKVV
jgi:L-histidine N-alpha-methyltransferase